MVKNNNEDNGQFVLKNFGNACELPLDVNSVPAISLRGCTPEFAAPEVLRIFKSDDSDLAKEAYNPFLADVYSLGLVLMRMIGFRGKTKLK